MRTAILALALLSAACVRVRTAGFDRQEGTVTTCGNKWADQSDLLKEAQRTCKTEEPVRCNREIVGFSGVTTATGYTVSSAVRALCCTYECG